jgi:hypothetical protein
MSLVGRHHLILTGDTAENLSRKTLNVTVWKRKKFIVFKKVIDTLVKQVHDDEDVAAKFEKISQPGESFVVFLIIHFEGFKNSKFPFCRILGFSSQSTDLNSYCLSRLLVDFLTFCNPAKTSFA